MMRCFGEDLQGPGCRIAYYDTQGTTYFFVISSVFSFPSKYNKKYFIKVVFVQFSS